MWKCPISVKFWSGEFYWLLDCICDEHEIIYEWIDLDASCQCQQTKFEDNKFLLLWCVGYGEDIIMDHFVFISIYIMRHCKHFFNTNVLSYLSVFIMSTKWHFTLLYMTFSLIKTWKYNIWGNNITLRIQYLGNTTLSCMTKHVFKEGEQYSLIGGGPMAKWNTCGDTPQWHRMTTLGGY